MRKKTMALVLGLLVVGTSVSAGHGGPEPITKEKIYEVGLVGLLMVASWNDPVFSNVTEDGQLDAGGVAVWTPKPAEADHPATVQVEVQDRIVDGPVAGAITFCGEDGSCPDIGPVFFCGESPPTQVKAEIVFVHVFGPLHQEQQCPDSDNAIGGVHGTVTARFSWS